jgi:hypothetical protein
MTISSFMTYRNIKNQKRNLNENLNFQLVCGIRILIEKNGMQNLANYKITYSNGNGKTR